MRYAHLFQSFWNWRTQVKLMRTTIQCHRIGIDGGSQAKNTFQHRSEPNERRCEKREKSDV